MSNSTMMMTPNYPAGAAGDDESTGHTHHSSDEDYRAKESDLELGLKKEKSGEVDTGTKLPDLRKEQQSSGEDSDGASRSEQSTEQLRQRRSIFTLLIISVGALAAGAFLWVGIDGANKDNKNQFLKRSEQLVASIEQAWSAYEIYGMWLHQGCNHLEPHNLEMHHNITLMESLGFCSREEFHRLYQTIESLGVEFQSLQFMPNITHAYREDLERDAALYYEENHPEISYRGIVGLNFPPEGGVSIEPQPEEESYFPVHYIEPLDGNAAAVDLDLLTSQIQKRTIEQAISSRKPAVTDRLKLVQDPIEHSFGIILHHPGANLPSAQDLMISSLALVVIRIPTLLERASRDAEDISSVYIYDSTHKDAPPVFLGGSHIDQGGEIANEIELDLLRENSNSDHEYQVTVDIADREWIVFVQAEQSFDQDKVNVIIGGVLILVSSFIVAVWFNVDSQRVSNYNAIKSEGEAERARNAHELVVRERHLNDFIAHEVRNPLSSAIAALSFVSAAVKEPDLDDSKKESIVSDIKTIDCSLSFISDLLRNMLDMNRASSKQMRIDKKATDIFRDIFDPVRSVVFLRGAKVKVLIDCDKQLMLMTDKLRLKQIILNLTMNATKFVDTGFIRLRADLDDKKNVRMFVEDSGPGIPVEKRRHLFMKFQESLDLLNQGTGIGLCVCKELSELMGADIYLDETYDSGVPDFPGTRFVLAMNAPPLDVEKTLETEDISSQGGQPRILRKPETLQQQETEIPDPLSVLFVDDDMILRKMFSRSLKRVAPHCTVDEASNGETAIQMIEKTDYDIVYIDMYMASIEKQLLGTETVRAMRALGCNSVLCGLSANDVEDEFLDAGADAFMFKPFPCEKEALKAELLRTLNSRNNHQTSGTGGTNRSISKGALAA